MNSMFVFLRVEKRFYRFTFFSNLSDVHLVTWKCEFLVWWCAGLRLTTDEVFTERTKGVSTNESQSTDKTFFALLNHIAVYRLTLILFDFFQMPFLLRSIISDLTTFYTNIQWFLISYVIFDNRKVAILIHNYQISDQFFNKNAKTRNKLKELAACKLCMDSCSFTAGTCALCWTLAIFIRSVF